MSDTEWLWLAAIFGAIAGFFGAEWTHKHWRSAAEKRDYQRWLLELDEIQRDGERQRKALMLEVAKLKEEGER